ncbi:LVIVD repeat-containing protein [Bacteroidota bacterium]
MKRLVKPHFIISIFLISLISLMFVGCEDDCNTTYYYIDYERVTVDLPQARMAVDIIDPEIISAPGKIYLYNQYLFINESGKGIHIVDNDDKRNPDQIGFINIPGNFDMAVKGNILYADNYVDLIAFDISNISDITEVKRLEGVFDDLYDRFAEEDILVFWEQVEKIGIDDSDCRDILPDFLRSDGGGWALGGSDMAVSMSPGAESLPGSSTGIGGSMARFTITGDILYTVGSYNLNVFDITVLTDPVQYPSINLEWGIETIFPFKDNLFIGSMNGMHIFEISNPQIPRWVSTFEHARVCDPVVANDTVAFVTLRSGTRCEGFTNQLDVIDIRNIYNPKLLKSYPMQHPHGLGIDNEALFICEGEHGWKLFEVKDLYTIDKNLIKHFKGIHSYDVIPYQDNLMLIGDDGLYQYDYTDLQNVELLSSLPIIVED